MDESQLDSVTVFAKLPRIGLETPLGRYHSDFGYAIHHKGQADALYLVVEAKGHDHKADIEDSERWKIESAKRFFDALKKEGVPVEFKTKINGEKLASLVASIVNSRPASTIPG